MSKIRITDADIEILSYIPNLDKEKNYVGIIAARICDLFVVRYKVVNKSQGEGYYLRVACYEVSNLDHPEENEYLDAFRMERHSDEEIIQQVIRNYYKRNILFHKVNESKPKIDTPTSVDSLGF